MAVFASSLAPRGFSTTSLELMSDNVAFVPALKILGLYSPKANEAEYRAVVEKYIAESDPANLDQETKDFLKRFGRDSELIPFDDADRASLREEIEGELGSAAYLEVLVYHPDERFEMIGLRT